MATDTTNSANAVQLARPVQFAAFARNQSESVPGMGNLDLLRDVGLRVTVELGRTQLPIRQVLPLGPGSIVELDRLAGEPVDVLVNGVLIARGEVVVVDEKFGVRVTEVLSVTRNAQ